MKKLLSICFLSILLGLMSFSVQAQNNNSGSCKSGFWIENLQPEIVTGIVNLPPDGTIDLKHTLGTSVYNPATQLVWGNANVNATERYKLHFCNDCGLDPKTKVSIDWKLYRDGKLVNDSLSKYADIKIFTKYARLNQYGQCEHIKWLGGTLNDKFGYCSPIVYVDSIYGQAIPQPIPTNYPGAMQPITAPGMPNSVLYEGDAYPAQGYINIANSYSLDFFYLDFFDQTENIVEITWKQSGNYSLVIGIRERLGGTDFPSLYWDETQQKNIGGHQSGCGEIIVQDSIHGLVKYDTLVEVCEDANAINPFKYGNPEYTFSNLPNPESGQTLNFYHNNPGSMPDTNVIWKHEEGAGDCAYTEVDSLALLHFFIRINPDLVSKTKEVCRCEPFTSADLAAVLDTVKTEGMKSAEFWWYKKVGTSTSTPTQAQLNNPANWTTTIPTPETEVGVYTYYVKQTTEYITIDCTGEIATITFTVNPIPAPVVTASKADFCNEQTYTNPTLTATVDDDKHCIDHIAWYYKDGNKWKSAGANGKTLTINLADYKPTTNIDKTVIFAAFAVGENSCDSTKSNEVKINFHQTPTITVSQPKVCPGDKEFNWTVTVTSTQTDKPYKMTNIKESWASSIADITLPNNNTNDSKQFKMNSKASKTDTKKYFECGKEYKTTFRVQDVNGCYVDSNLVVKPTDTEKPKVNPAAITTYVNACAVDDNSYPKYNFANVTSSADFKLKNVKNMPAITDNCHINWAKTTMKDSVVTPSGATCEAVTIRTYTFYDYCDNTATLTQTIIARDSVKPYFDFVTNPTPNGMPYIRIKPVSVGNCIYDAPDSMVFVNAVKDYVADNCTDKDYLISTLKFTWEKTDISPINAKNIFISKNHLTVSATITDRCGNDSTQMVIYIDKPDTLKFTGRVQLDPICENTSTTLSFDTNRIVDDSIQGPFKPYTYKWTVLNGREINFSNVNSIQTTASPVGSGDFYIVMEVTNSNGCTSKTDPMLLHVNPTPNVAIYRDVRNGESEPYCPTYGDLRVYAADATTGEKLTGLTYKWSGESVNEAPTTDSSWVTIVPEYCKHNYGVKVRATDAIGCYAEAVDTIKVEDTEGLIFNGVLKDSTVLVNAGCKMYIPDFQPFFTSSTIDSKCWNWTDIISKKDAQGNPIWYKQSPKAGEVMTQNTEITITLTAPCNDKTTTYKVKALVPEDILQVKIVAVGDSICENDPAYQTNGVTITAIPVNGEAAYTYKWTRNDVVLTGATYADSIITVYDMTENNQNTIINYAIEVVDALGCKATADVEITIFYKGTLPDTTTFPNTLCVGHNGSLVLDGVLRNYTYYFQNQVKIHDVPEHQVTPFNGMVFDHCYAGTDMPLVVETPDGCQQTMYITIANDNDDKPATPSVTKKSPTDCFQKDGQITVTNLLTNSTYYVQKNNEDYAQLTVNPITNVTTTDVFNFFCVDNATGCVSDTLKNVKVDPYNSGFVVSATVTNNTSCKHPWNGKLTLNDAAHYYVVTPIALGSTDTIYKGLGNITIDTLKAGKYKVYEKNLSTDCDAVKEYEVKDSQVFPYLTVTPKPNYFCDPDTANGTFTYTVKANTASGSTMAANSYTLVLTNASGDVIPSDKWNSLYAGSYTLTATSTLGCTNNNSKKSVSISNKALYPKVTLATTKNNFCDEDKWDGTVTVTVAKPNNATSTDPWGTKFAYNLKGQGVDSTVNDKTSPFTFGKLNGGTYTVKVTTEFGCSATADKTVDQYVAPALVLSQTPNTMCAPTFEKPGNGIIHIHAPLATADGKHFYHYNYYYASDPDMDVPYHDPLTLNKYWLAAREYHVIALDTVTGCKAEGNYTVKDSTFNVTPQFEVDKNTNCEDGHYNGKITVAAVNSTNLNAKWLYSMDNTTFTSNNVFTGLNAGTYTVYMKDTTVNCVYSEQVSIENGNQCSPVVTITDTKGNTGSKFNYCIGDVVNLIAEAKAADGCTEGDYQYTWIADCHNLTSNTDTISAYTDQAPSCCRYNVTVKSLATGCTSVGTVEVCVSPNPVVIFEIDDQQLTGNTASVCVNQAIKIGVKKNHIVGGYDYANLEKVEWTNAISSTSFDTIIKANTLTPNTTYTFSIDVWNKFGCTSRGTLSLTVNDVPTVVVYDTVCTQFSFKPVGAKATGMYDNNGNLVLTDITPSQTFSYGISGNDRFASAEYKFDGNQGPVFVYECNATGCDSLVIHQVTFLGIPNIEKKLNGNVEVCDGTTYADILTAAKIEIKNAKDTALVIAAPSPQAGDEVKLTDIVDFANGNLQYVNIICTSGADSCATTYTLPFYVTGKPKVTQFQFTNNAYCAGSDMTLNYAFAYNQQKDTKLNVQLMLIDSTDVNNVKEEVIANLKGQTSPYNFTARLRYGAAKHYFALKVINNCDSAYSTPVHIRVDSTVVKLNNVTICEGQTVSFDDVLGQNKNLFISGTSKAWKISNNTSTEITQSTTITASAKITFTGLDGGACPSAKCDTVQITVNPKPSFTVIYNDLTLCYDEAKSIINSTVKNVKNATSQGWMIAGYTRNALNGTAIAPTDTINVASIDELISKAANDYYQVETFYYAKNACDSIAKSTGKFRVVSEPTITSSTPVDMCYSDTLGAVVKAANVKVAWNNIIANSNDSLFNNKISYAIVHNNVPTAIATSSSVVLTPIAKDGDSLRIVTIGDCENDTAFVKLNISTITFVEDTLKAACAGENFSQFIKKQPQFTGKATVESTKWYIAQANNMSAAQVITEATEIKAEDNGKYVMHVWFTSCGDSVSTTPKALAVNVKPEVNFTNDTLKVCFNADSVPAFTVVSNPDAIDTTWTINGTDIADISAYKYKTGDTMLVVAVKNDCGTTKDTIVVKVLPLPTPQAIGDTIVCLNKQVDLKVSNVNSTSTYAWFNASGVKVADGANATITSEEGVNDYYVVETDINGCVSTNNSSVTVESSDNPQFVFTYNGAETHTINGITTSKTDLLNYTWKLDQMCLNPDTLVYVYFHIYHNGKLIPQNERYAYFAKQVQQLPTSQGGGTQNWIGSDHIEWTNANGSHNTGFTTYYDASSVLTTGQNPYAGNHFPSSTLGTDNGNFFTSFYLHFFNDREVSKVVAPMMIPGEYKIVYELWSTNHNEYFHDLYKNEETNSNKFIGAQNALSSTSYGLPTIFSLLATDSLIINVTGDTLVAEPTSPSAPAVAPVVIENNAVQPEMQVWPNPAQASTTKLNYRVYNMSGEANVAISEMTGREIAGKKVFIDSNDFKDEITVNNLSQGVYIISIRTAEGVVTKKVVVKR